MYNEILLQLEDDFPTHDNLLDAKKLSKFFKFNDNHMISQTYFFQVRKCDDADCPYHKPLRSLETISAFPDPVPSEVDGVLD